MHSYVGYSIVHGGQVVKTTEVPFHRGLDKEDAEHTHNGILLGHRK